MDSELVSRAARGDHEAYTSIVHAVLDQFHGIAYSILRDAYLAEDAVQAALIAVWRDLPKLRDPDRFGAWSKRILLNSCYSEARSRNRFTQTITDDAGVTSAGERADAGAELQTVLDRDLLERGFMHLSVDQRTVMVLHYFLDLPAEQAAEVLDIPVGTFKSRVHRATSALRAGLDADRRAAERTTSPGEVAG